MKKVLGLLGAVSYMIIVSFMFPFFAFGVSTVTTAGTTAPGYVSIPDTVRAIYSKEIIYQAQPFLRFQQFCKERTDLTAQRGKSIVFNKYNSLSGGGFIGETQSIESEGMVAGEVVINLQEAGNATTVTEFLLRTSLHNQLSEAATLLAANYGTVLDGQYRDLMLSTGNTIFGGGKTTAASLAAGDGITTQTIMDAAEYLALQNTPKFDGQYYVCIANPHQVRQLREDPDWRSAHTYSAGTRQLYIGEVGMYEGIIFLDSTQMPMLTTAEVVTKYGAGFTPANGWEAVFFGANSFARGIGLDVELRDNGVEEFGRKRALAWYAIYGIDFLESKYVLRCLTA